MKPCHPTAARPARLSIGAHIFRPEAALQLEIILPRINDYWGPCTSCKQGAQSNQVGMQSLGCLRKLPRGWVEHSLTSEAVLLRKSNLNSFSSTEKAENAFDDFEEHNRQHLGLFHGQRTLKDETRLVQK